MLAIVVATEFELGDQDFVWREEFGLRLSYLSDDVCLIISGPGLAKTALALVGLEKFKQQYPNSQFVNIGIAGSLAQDEVGAVFMPGNFAFAASAKVESAMEGLVDSCYPQINLRNDETIATVPVPLWDKAFASLLADQGCRLVDMESYFFASWAQESEVEFYFIKVVSDRADQESKVDFKTNVRVAINKISVALDQLKALISSSKRVDLAAVINCFGINS